MVLLCKPGMMVTDAAIKKDSLISSENDNIQEWEMTKWQGISTYDKTDVLIVISIRSVTKF